MLNGKPPYQLITPLKNRISFLYCRYGQVSREQNSLVFKQNGIEYDLPVANLTALMLSTGTSITQPAVMEIARWGCNISFVQEECVGVGASFPGLNTNSQLLIKQAEISSNVDKRTEMARKMYALRWGEDSIPKSYGIKKMMTYEGRRMKDIYSDCAKSFGYNFQRKQNYDESDPINQNITSLYHMLYGLSNAFIVSLGASPGLGIIHHGNSRSFVFDVADLYKERMIAFAFRCAHENIYESDLRKAFHKYIQTTQLREKLIDSILYCLGYDEDYEKIITDESQSDSFLWSKNEIINNEGFSL